MVGSFILAIPACIFPPAFPVGSFSPQRLTLGHPKSLEKEGLSPLLLLVSLPCWILHGLWTHSEE